MGRQQTIFTGCTNPPNLVSLGYTVPKIFTGQVLSIKYVSGQYIGNNNLFIVYNIIM